MEKEKRKIYKQHFTNKKKKYNYYAEFNNIVFEGEFDDLQEQVNSFRHTCLEETLKRFLGDDYGKLYDNQQFEICDDVNDCYTMADKLEFYTKMQGFTEELRKKYNFDSSMNLMDMIDFCSKNSQKLLDFINSAEKNKKNEEIKKDDK